MINLEYLTQKDLEIIQEATKCAKKFTPEYDVFEVKEFEFIEEENAWEVSIESEYGLVIVGCCYPYEHGHTRFYEPGELFCSIEQW